MGINMKTLKKILTTTGYHLYYSLASIKVWSGITLILAAIYLRVHTFAEIAGDFNVSVSIGIIALVCSDPFVGTVIFYSLLFIFSELPFQNPQQMLLLTRSGKRSWYISQLLYIIVASLFVELLIILFSMLLLAGHLSFGNSWGKVINTAVRSNEMRKQYDIMRIVPDTINTFTPYKALAWNLPCGTLTYIVFGNIVYALNVISRRSAGIIAGAVLIVFHFFCGYFIQSLFWWFSPLEWSDINTINITHISRKPTPEYAVCALLGLYIISVFIIVFSSRKKVDVL